MASDYTLQADRPPTGSRIKHDVALSALPFDKTYDELTSEQIDLLRSAYEGLATTDEPAYPVAGLGPMVREISQAQQKLQLRGRVFAVASVDETGKVRSVALHETPSARMSQLVAYVLVRTAFKPARCNGTPCAMDYPLSLSLRLRQN